MTDELEIFDSNQNIEANQADIADNLRISGEFSFKIPKNKSAKKKITFGANYSKKPKFTCVVSVSTGSVLDLSHAFENFDCTSIIVHLLNKDKVNEVCGKVTWFVEPF